MNQQNYNNILAGYQNTETSNRNAQGRIIVGHQNLEANVLGSIAGIDRSQRQDIADQYAKNIGTSSQDLINRGLGNSTIQSSVGRGMLYDKAKSDIALTNATQGLNAQYMSQLGLARLGYENQAAQQNTQWAGKQLDFMNSVNAGYPDPRTYAMLAQMKGQSGGGGGVGSGATTMGGAVKSPLGGGGGYPTMGGVSYGNSFGTGGARAPNPYGGYSPGEIYPESQFSSGAAGDFGANSTMYNWENNNGQFSQSQPPEDTPWWLSPDSTGVDPEEGWSSGGGSF
jgi:hypothetical protein